MELLTLELEEERGRLSGWTYNFRKKKERKRIIRNKVRGGEKEEEEARMDGRRGRNENQEE